MPPSQRLRRIKGEDAHPALEGQLAIESVFLSINSFCYWYRDFSFLCVTDATGWDGPGSFLGLILRPPGSLTHVHALCSASLLWALTKLFSPC